MLIRVGYDIIFEHPAPTPIITMLYLHPSRRLSLRRGDYLLVEPRVQVSDYTDVFGNRCGRLLAPAGPMRFWNDAVVEDSGQPDRFTVWTDAAGEDALWPAANQPGIA